MWLGIFNFVRLLIQWQDWIRGAIKKICTKLFKTIILCWKAESFIYTMQKKELLGRACGVLAVGVRAVDCLHWRSGQYFHQSFHFSSVATFSHRRSARIKKLIYQKLLRMPKNLGEDTSPDPVGHFGAQWQAVRRCRRCGVAGGERVPPAPLGWYF